MPTDLQLIDALTKMAGPAGAVAWMVLLSNAIRNYRSGDLELMTPADQEMARWLRTFSLLQIQFLMIVLSGLVPTAAALVLWLVPRETLLALQPTFAFCSMLFMAFLGQQIWFQVTKFSPTHVTNNAISVSTGKPEDDSGDGWTELIDDGVEEAPTLLEYVGRPAESSRASHPGIVRQGNKPRIGKDGRVRYDEDPNKEGIQSMAGTFGQAAKAARALGIKGNDRIVKYA
jgi:hypothetical protein